MGSQRIAEGALSALRTPTEPAAETVLVPVGQPKAKPRAEKPVDGWFRELNEGRMEAMVKSPDCRLRVTGTPTQVWEAIELWERWTGLTVNAEKRPRRIPAPIPGQITMEELQSEGNRGSE